MYCLKCRRVTDTDDMVETVTSNGRNMMKGRCVVCGTTKNKFIKKTGGRYEIGPLDKVMLNGPSSLMHWKSKRADRHPETLHKRMKINKKIKNNPQLLDDIKKNPKILPFVFNDN